MQTLLQMKIARDRLPNIRVQTSLPLAHRLFVLPAEGACLLRPAFLALRGNRVMTVARRAVPASSLERDARRINDAHTGEPMVKK